MSYQSITVPVEFDWSSGTYYCETVDLGIYRGFKFWLLVGDRGY